MNSLTRKVLVTALLGVLLLATQGFCRFDVWDPEDGVAVRQGDHIMWMNSGIQKAENGGYCFAWSDAYRGSQDVYVQMYNEEGQPQWGDEGLLISGGDWSEQEPQLAYVGNDEWVIIWRDFRDDHAKWGIAKHCMQRINSNGEILWDDAIMITSPSSRISQFQFEVAEDNSVIAIWLEQNHLYGQRVLQDGTLDWIPNNQVLNTFVSDFDFVVTPENEIAVVLYETEQNWFDGAVNVHKFDFAGNSILEQPTLIFDEFWADNFRILNVGNNELLVLYEYRGVCAQLLNENSEPVWSADEDGVVLHEGTITLGYATKISDNQICYTYYDDDENSHYSQLITLDENLPGGFELMWDDGNDDAGIQFSGGDNYNSSTMIQLDDTGDLIFSWREDLGDGTNSFAVTRYNVQGESIWEAPYHSTFKITPCGYSRAALQLDDELLFIWNTNYGTETGLFQQKIDMLTGEPVYEENGIPLQTGISYRANKPQILVTGENAFVFWEEFRTIKRQFYMQKLDLNSGDPLFAEQGIDVHANLPEREAIDFEHFSVAQDANDGFLFFANQLDMARVSQDYRINRIDSDGNLLWGDEGVFLREPENDQDFRNESNIKSINLQDGSYFIAFNDFNEEWWMELKAQRLNSSGEWMLGPQGATLMTLDGSDVELCAIDKFSDETIVIVYTTISAINSELYADILTTDGERILADPIRLHNVANDEKRYSSVSLHPLNNGREMVALFLCRMDNENGVSHQQVVMQKIDVDGDLLLGEEGIILSEEESDVRTFAVSQTPNDRFWIMAHVYDTEMAYLKIAEYTREGQLENVIDPIEPMDNLDEIKLEGDGQGGVYAFYRGITERWEDGDLYYYHFDREGNLVDPAYEGQGVPLSTAWYSQVDLVTASDGAGGVVTAWTDFRGSGGDIPEDDIYALRVNDFTVSADEKDNTTLPHQWAIESVYPNPFNPSTTITYTVPVQSTVNLLVFDILGQEVASLIKSNQLAGRYQVVWDGKSNSGVSVASGIYLVQLEAGGISLTSKLTLIK